MYRHGLRRIVRCRLTLRELFLIVVIASLVIVWWNDRRQLDHHRKRDALMRQLGIAVEVIDPYVE